MSSFSKSTRGGLLGSFFGPVGTAVGAAVGLGSALLGSSRKSDTAYQQVTPLPRNFYSPFGNVLFDGTTMRFNPTLNPNQKAILETTNQKLQTLSQNLPTAFDVSAAFKNPFYSATLNHLSREIDHQRAQDQRDMNNALSAKNQLGSSFEALQKNLMDQRYDKLYQDAREQARQVSADIFQQQFENQLDTLSSLRNENSALLDSLYYPLRFGV